MPGADVGHFPIADVTRQPLLTLLRTLTLNRAPWASFSRPSGEPIRLPRQFDSILNRCCDWLEVPKVDRGFGGR